jgi:hypothetical protein
MAHQTASEGSYMLRVGNQADIGVLPLVNGVVLGYPFIYNVTAGNVNCVSRKLSTIPLLLFR